MNQQLQLIETGTKEGYREYHGDIFLGFLTIGTWHKDVKQGLLIAMNTDKSPVKFKIYAKTSEGIKHKLQALLEIE